MYRWLLQSQALPIGFLQLVPKHHNPAPMPNYHFYDINRIDVTEKGKGWKGFTRDYHQLEGVFSENGGVYEINPTEYLNGLMLYSKARNNCSWLSRFDSDFMKSRKAVSG